MPHALCASVAVSLSNITPQLLGKGKERSDAYGRIAASSPCCCATESAERVDGNRDVTHPLVEIQDALQDVEEVVTMSRLTYVPDLQKSETWV
jgi:hypothetical protein